MSNPKKTTISKGFLLIASVVIGLTSVATTIAVAGTAGAETTPYYACLKGGKLSHVGATATACPGGAGISWNAVGATGGTGPQGPVGLQGINGPAGPTGPTGPAGANGSTVLNGSGPPVQSLGNVGDFYIDTSANEIWGPKTLGVCRPVVGCVEQWPVSGSQLSGPVGPQGIAGPVTVQGGYHDGGVDSIQDDNPAWQTLETMTIKNTGPYAVFAKFELNDGSNLGSFTDVDCQLTSPNAADPGVLENLPLTGKYMDMGVTLMFTSPSLTTGQQIVLQCQSNSEYESWAATDIKITAIEAGQMITQTLAP